MENSFEQYQQVDAISAPVAESENLEQQLHGSASMGEMVTASAGAGAVKATEPPSKMIRANTALSMVSS